MVKTESEFLRFLLWKQMKEGYSSPIPVIKQEGDILKLNFCIQVEKMAIQGESLKVIAKYKPFGSQATLWGRPPTSRCPTVILVKSATGKACLGAEPAKIFKQIFNYKLMLRKKFYFKICRQHYTNQ